MNSTSKSANLASNGKKSTFNLLYLFIRKLAYIKSNRFLNEFINSILKNKHVVWLQCIAFLVRFFNPKHSLSGKIICYNIIPLFIITPLLGLYYIHTEIESTKKRAIESIRNISQNANDTLSDQIYLVHQAINSLTLTQEHGQFSNRKDSIKLMKRIIQKSSTLSGIFINYMPNADGQDAYYKNVRAAEITEDAIIAKEVSTHNGTFSPILQYDPLFNNQLVLSNYSTPLENIIYGYANANLMLGNEQQIINLDPFIHEGRVMLESVKPLVIQGNVVGLIGAHNSTDSIRNTLNYVKSKFKQTTSANFILLSDKHKIIANTLDDGQSFGTILEQTPYAEILNPILNESDVFKTKNLLNATGNSNMNFTQHHHENSSDIPIVKPNLDFRTWNFISASIPKDVYLYHVANKINGTNLAIITQIDLYDHLMPLYLDVVGKAKIIGFTLFALILFQLVTLIYMQRRINHVMFGFKDLLNDNDFDPNKYELNSHDEIGKLSRYLAFLYNLKNQLTDACTAIANGDYTKKMDLEADINLLNAVELLRNNRQAIEEGLKENIQLLQGIIENDRSAIAFKDNLGRYQFINKAWEEMNGIKRDDTIDNTDYDIFSLQLADHINKEDQKVINSLEALESRAHVVINGAPGIYQFYKYPVVNFTGELIGLAIIANDITDYIEVQNSLNTQLELHKLIYTTIPYPTLYLSTNAIVKIANPAFCRIFNCRAEDIENKNITSMTFLPAEYARRMNVESRKAIQTGELIIQEFEVRLYDGKLHYFQYLAQGFKNPDGSPGGLIATLIDITVNYESEQKLLSKISELSDTKRSTQNMLFDLERQRKLAEELRAKAEEATTTKANFLAAMSHEIRTPMNGVIGMIDLLRESHLDSEQSLMMRTVRDSAFSLLQIINDILDFSKIEAGKMLIETIPISLRDLIEGVCETLASGAQKKSLQLESWIDPNIPDWVEGDQIRLRQILFNLLGNAIKFTQTTPVKLGLVKVEATFSNIRLDSGLPEEEIGGNIYNDGYVQPRLLIKIIDNGVGMSKEAMTKLFQPFTQAESSTTRRFGGTGLGLTISKDLAELMHGEIQVNTEEGMGSTFTLSLPFVGIERDIPNDEPWLTGIRVLIYIENESSRAICISYLKAKYADIKIVSSEEELLEYLTRSSLSSEFEPFHVLLADGRVAGITGQKLLARIRMDIGIIPLNIVLLSSSRNLKGVRNLPDLQIIEDMPIRRLILIRSIAIAGGRLSPETEQIIFGKNIKLQAPSIEEALLKNQLILIAEDNLTNQDVIRRQLATMGFACEIANDGLEALEMLKNRKYNLLLTDCHMPNMDGYELTQSIREKEKNNYEHLPIVALTANALHGEGDRCLEIGMDDYLSKPLELQRLKFVLRRWLPSHKEDEIHLAAKNETIEEAPSQKSKQLEVIAFNDLIQMLGSDKVAFVALIEFVKPSHLLIDLLLKDTDCKQISVNTHKLKNAAAAIRAKQLQELCVDIESICLKNDYDKVMPKIEMLNLSLQRVYLYILEHTEDNQLSYDVRTILNATKQQQSKAFKTDFIDLDVVFNYNQQLNDIVFGTSFNEFEQTNQIEPLIEIPTETIVENIHIVENMQIEQSEPEVVVLNPEQLLRDFDQDIDLVRDIIAGFIETSGPYIAEIIAASNQDNANLAGQGGHKLKSAARSIGANELADLCHEIELAGKSENLILVQELVSTIEGVFIKVKQAATEF